MPYDLPDWIADKIMPEPNSGCWIWLSAMGGGYGRLRTGRHEGYPDLVQAHRLVYEFYKGPCDSEVVDHLCRNQFCVNPDHLEPTTNKINVLRGTGIAAVNAKKEFCPHGHSLSDAYISNGNRVCRTCRIARSIAFKKKKRAAL
jgi:HNH endonuclease